MTDTGKARNVFHDLYDDKLSTRLEVKFATVNAKHREVITLENLLVGIEEAGLERAVPFERWKSYSFDANIQQIKTKEFEVLYYGLFFEECVVIFKVSNRNVKSDRRIGYSDKQHKGNVGEGQFHITNKNLSIHLNSYLYKKISYEELITTIS